MVYAMIIAGAVLALAAGLVGLGGYLHYRYGSKVKAAGEAAVAELKR